MLMNFFFLHPDIAVRHFIQLELVWGHAVKVVVILDFFFPFLHHPVASHIFLFLAM